MEKLAHNIDIVPMEMYPGTIFVQNPLVICLMPSNQANPLEGIYIKGNLRRLIVQTYVYKDVDWCVLLITR